MQKNVIIVGGGPAGIEAAKTVALAGGKATLISNGPIGGRAGWHSLLPSKVWLSTADALGMIQGASSLGLTTKSAEPDIGKVLSRIQTLTESWSQAQAEGLRQLGVVLISGSASFKDESTIVVQDKDGKTKKLAADAVIVASGSVPIFPANMKPDGKRIIAPRFAKALQALPKSIIVVGGGVTGCEFVYLFNRVGIQVTWIVDEYGVLPTYHDEVGHALAEALAEQGIQVVAGQTASQIDVQSDGVRVILANGMTFNAEMAFLAIGRKPDVADLNLAAAGVAEMDVDCYGRIPNTPIYLAGDVTGAPMVANRAMAQARVAGLHAVMGEGIRPFQPQSIIAATYTEPQAAQVGDVSEQYGVVRVPYTAVLKANLTPEANGFLCLTYSKDNHTVKGAFAFGSHAADLLSPVAVAIQQEATLADLAMIFPAHPTLSELVFVAARSV